MDNIYLVIVAVMFALAISDLIVGVSNDAVNFLNSALGAKAGSFKLIMTIAALGVLVGSVFSDGMMEVARKGIFHPEYFYFSEIMTIFLAVMITDIILLDTFNTLGLPTSTTVSIVFELLGAAVAMSLIKIANADQIITLENGSQKIATLIDYINTEKALLIISGILLSVVVSFTVGAIVQWFTRLLFTFNYEKNIKFFSAIWGGLAITAITYFILIKGAKNATFMSSSIQEYTKDHWYLTIIGSFVFWSVILQIFTIFFKRFNVLKFITLVGTFALAMAFAGNDLVNFIGVPLASFESYKAFSAIPGADPDTFSMASLSGKVHTDAYLLVIAGLVMVATLYLSKKAKTVVKTSVDLSRQSEGEERFGSSLFARNLVRASIKTGETINMFLPTRLRNFIDKGFDQTNYKIQQAKAIDPPAFDLIRASVNLVVASILIAFATSQKLPLSTTYVTFMVAMGTSLADKAWGRESAVYRITGVLSVIGGWFFTAFSAFMVAFIIAYIINWGGIYAIGGMIILGIFLIYRSHIYHKKHSEEDTTNIQKLNEINDGNIIEQCTSNVYNTLYSVSDIYSHLVEGIDLEDRKKLKEVTKEVQVLNHQAKSLKDNVYNVLKRLRKDSVAQSHHYAQVLDYLRETAHCFTYMAKPSYEYFDNNHRPFTSVQRDELKKVSALLSDFNAFVLQIIETNQFEKLTEVFKKRDELIDTIEKFRRAQMIRLKQDVVGSKNSMLYLGLLHETKNLLLHTVNLAKAQRDFVKNAG
ncbi:MAG: inorganic phosphate transporter [Bacteroidales bacterium]|nr:inorganic phosphate transporter [Bacteroidales bacterium]